ncbi:MAG: alanine glycine permease [Myxococcales bacterium]|nr:alanine glycine permease [Myxococcales bacterium]
MNTTTTAQPEGDAVKDEVVENGAADKPASVPSDPSVVVPSEAVEAPPAVAEATPTDQVSGFESVDKLFGTYLVGPIATVMFWDVMFWDNNAQTNHQLPFVVIWLVLGAIFFTFRMGFINIRGFWHGVELVRGKYSSHDDEGHGEVSHFQALSSALSATVGLGNIAGVAIAVGTGGPGAIFWLIVAGFLGMSSKFTECTLGQAYKQKREDGRVMGGAMYYLSDGLADLKMPTLGKVLAALFCILCIGGSFGGGNSFQVNQSLNAVQSTVPFFADNPAIYGLIMTIAVGVVILGGISRIASVAEKIVPAMCGIYVLACLYIIFANIGALPNAVGIIIDGAFNADSMYGGFLGVLVIGFKRAAFSNEAGVGSAAIAHSAAKTKIPVREGFVSLLEPFIDTIVVCTMTGLVIVMTGAYDMGKYGDLIKNNKGAALTSAAFESVIPWFPYLLSVAVILFAFSTMISWSYYGERCSCYLFGDKATLPYRLLFLGMTFLGSVITSTNILDLSDLMILGMAFPNILGVILLSGKVRAALDDYMTRLRNGEYQPNE